jgi:hypothetical protein
MMGAIAPSQAEAAVFSFNGSDNGLPTITKTVDGITLTLSNPSPSSTFRADADGLAVLSQGNFTNISSFQLSFSSAVQLLGYNVGYIETLDGNESLTLTDGSSTSVENSPFTTGARNFSNQFTVAANQPITVTGTGVDLNDIIQWSSLEVAAAPVSVPEPSGLIGLGVMGLGLLRFKRQIKID